MKKILKTLKHKWAEYLLEIIVITIGILGAFTLNNWNEDRKNQELERTYLQNINKEFKANKIQFESILMRRKSILDLCSKTNTRQSLSVQSWDSLKGDYLKIMAIITYDPTHGSIQSLLNSTSLDIIRNIELRNLLINWPTMVEDFKEEEIWLMQNNFKCFDWLNENTDRSNLKLMNADRLLVFQNLIHSSCQINNLLVNSNSQGRSENDELSMAIDRIIELTEPGN